MGNRLFLSLGMSVLLHKGSCLEPSQTVLVVADGVLTGEGTVVLRFTCLLGLQHLLPGLNNLAYSYL